MTEHKISIITPTFNMGHYIEQNIKSVLSQTHKEIQHIIIDNNSQDYTEALVNKYIKQYKLVYLREGDTGQANAINKGLNMATGDIICWLNADDYYYSDRSLEMVIKAFEGNKWADVVTGKGVYVNADGKVLKVIQLPRSIDELSFHDPILQPATFWKRNQYRLKEKYNYVFDWVMFLDSLRLGMRFYALDEILAAYRMDGKNKTALDTASRKYEVYEVNLEYNGLGSANTLWCYIVYMLYLASEKTGILLFKKIVRHINQQLYRWTGRIYSS
jgi:glycosyltransferase involved in cell wall biosynthesis